MPDETDRKTTPTIQPLPGASEAIGDPRLSGRGAPTPIATVPVDPRSARPTAPEPVPAAGRGGEAGLDGTLASYLERVASRTAAAFGVQAVAIALVGDDRRCFVGGTAPPSWLTRDPGALIRSRACAMVLES